MKFRHLFKLLVIIFVGCTGNKTESTEPAEAQATESAAESTPTAELDTLTLDGIPLSALERTRLRDELFFHFRRLVGVDENAYVRRESLSLFSRKFNYVAVLSNTKADPRRWTGQTDMYQSSHLDSVNMIGTFTMQRMTRGDLNKGGFQEIAVWVLGTMHQEYWEIPYQAATYGDEESTGGLAEENEVKTTFDGSAYGLDNSYVQVVVGNLRVYTRENMYLKMRIRELTDEDVAGYSRDDLGYLRNEVFARHGHTFKTPKMINYFSEKNWYKAWVNDATQFLNDAEKRNVEFIKSKEAI